MLLCAEKAEVWEVEEVESLQIWLRTLLVLRRTAESAGELASLYRKLCFCLSAGFSCNNKLAERFAKARAQAILAQSSTLQRRAR